MGYISIKEFWYSVDNMMHPLPSNKGPINVLKVTRYCSQVNLFVVHRVEEPEVVENWIVKLEYVIEIIVMLAYTTY